MRPVFQRLLIGFVYKERCGQASDHEGYEDEQAKPQIYGSDTSFKQPE
jgi:hypothetical protein